MGNRLRPFAPHDWVGGVLSLGSLALLVAGGDVVFASRPADLQGTSPRVVFLQNADDPVAWWDPDLILDEPDWMTEELDPAVNPEISWGPLRSFLQISVDMAVGNSFDEGSGHLYGALPTLAWRQMLDPDLTDAQDAALSARMSRLGR